jgi:hypothetical protein
MLLHYCRVCRRAVCTVCQGVDHSDHPCVTLADITNELSREFLALQSVCSKNTHRLTALLDDLPAASAGAHRYVDDDVDALATALEDKRGALHADVNERAAAMCSILDAEIALCESELRQLDDARSVFDCMAVGDGIVEGELGQLISGGISYDEFWALAHRELHAPQRMLHPLNLQLPMDNLQEVCDRLAWTEQSEDNAQLVFPV